MEWISDLFGFVRSLFPALVVLHENEVGARMRAEQEAEALEPGRYVYWPIVTSIETVTTAQQTLEIEPLTLMARATKDATDWTTVIAGCVVVFHVTDPLKFLVYTADADEAIGEIAGGALRKVIIDWPIDRLQNGRAEVDHKLAKELTAELEECGVSVVRVRLTNFSSARVINCVGAQPLLPAEDE